MTRVLACLVVLFATTSTAVASETSVGPQAEDLGPLVEPVHSDPCERPKVAGTSIHTRNGPCEPPEPHPYFDDDDGNLLPDGVERTMGGGDAAMPIADDVDALDEVPMLRGTGPTAPSSAGGQAGSGQGEARWIDPQPVPRSGSISITDGRTEGVPLATASAGGDGETVTVVSTVAAGLGVLLAWVAWRLAALVAATRHTRGSILDHERRRTIFDLVASAPGLSLNEVARRTGIGASLVAYHVRHLERQEMVTTRSRGRTRHVFACDAGRVEVKDAWALFQNERTRRLADLIATCPGITQKELCGAVGVSPSLAYWHLSRLGAAGIVEKKRKGRVVAYHGTSRLLRALQASDRHC